jgi:hypothetical protein
VGSISARQEFSAIADGFVTCLRVAGNRAAVGAVGHLPGSPSAKETILATFVDGGPSGTDTVAYSIAPGSTPPDCASASFAGQTSIDPSAGDLVVNDAP